MEKTFQAGRPSGNGSRRVTTPQAQRKMEKTFQAREPSGNGSRRVTTPQAHQNDSTATATDSDGKFGHLGQRLLHIWTLALLGLELSVASWPIGTSPASSGCAAQRLLHIWTLALLSLELSVASWPSGTSPASIAAALQGLKLLRAGLLSQDNGQMSKRETCPLSLRLAPLRRLRVTAYQLCSVTPCDRISMIHCHRHPRYRHPLRRLVHKVVSVDQVQPSSSAAF